MKAKEAACYSKYIMKNYGNPQILFNSNGIWKDSDGCKYDLNSLVDVDYVPLAPQKIYNVGDEIYLYEALYLGLTFRFLKSSFSMRWKDNQLQCLVIENNIKRWKSYTSAEGPIDEKVIVVSTKKDEISIEELKSWTRFIFEFRGKYYDLRKLPTGEVVDYLSGLPYTDISEGRIIEIFDEVKQEWVKCITKS